ncbi:MAG TPA: multidrug efflux RND transporter permease subunit [Gemmataceae bacterium]|nr:multidrug efflux RND transporter permease subunit [Gemmataceae bacterium]
MISRFFIDRPIFAAVLSVFITLAGAIAAFNLPLAQFPQISPPTVSVTCQYPGASAKDVAESVAAPIEQQVNGVEKMMYMSSSCTNDGSYSLTVTFEHGIDLNMAQVLVENRVNLALPSLPTVIKQTGVTTRKRSPDILMGMSLNAPDGRYNQLYLSNYALLQIRDELLRIEGVSDILLFGQRDYSMRIWVDPDKLAARNLNASDVVRAIREQNAQVATGSIGQQPVAQGQQLQITLDTLGRLSEVKQFEDIILRTTVDGRILRLKDVARVELGAKNADVSVNFDGRDTIFLAVFQMPDANALDVHERVLARVRELEKDFPEGMVCEVAFDTTPYTSESIKEVFKTLRDAIILVAVVVLLFLQNWRSSIIPLIAVPVAIIGTFAVMLALGFSLNNLTLFGLVLAIGIVVDDAIVVVEAVEHHIEHGLAPREATIKAMEQVSGPVIAVGLVLSAVFVPCAFISGITGHFFRQFALTISVSTIISAFNSLTLSPALAAVLLKPRATQNAPPLPRVAFALAGGWAGWYFLTDWLTYWMSQGAEHLPASYAALAQPMLPWAAPAVMIVFGVMVGWITGRVLNYLLGWFFRTFNAAFGVATNWYTRSVGMMLRVSFLVLVVYGVLVATTVWRFLATPKGFIPSQDMGYMLVNVQLPDSASAERTDAVMRQLQDMARSTPGVLHATAIRGQSFVLNAYGSNFGSMFINLDDYDKRRDPSLSSDAIAMHLRKEFSTKISEAQVAVFGPPPVRGAGRAGGFSFMLEDRGDLGAQELQKQTENLVRRAYMPPDKGVPPLVGVFSVFRANVPQLHIEADPRECLTKGVQLTDFADTLAIYQGSTYVNDFNLFGRTWQVIVQADSQFRDQPEDLPRLKIRNRKGNMVPLGSLANVRPVNGPLVLTRYNMYPSASINGSAPPGMSSFDAIAIMKKLAKEELPPGMGYEWTDMSYLEVKSGDDAMKIFGLAVLMVFLVLAFQYENWSLPLAVILVVPMCLLSAIIGVNIAHMDINIFTRIGFVVLVGLASKNAILIVEFAKVQRSEGVPRRQATLEACKLRLRPIIMTSLAFVLGVLPLMISHGAGFEMRRTLGTAVFSGMLGVTLFGIFLTPVFFYTIDSLGETRLFASHLVRWTSGALLQALMMILWPPTLFRRLRAIPAASLNASVHAPVPRKGGSLAPPTHLRESVKQK